MESRLHGRAAGPAACRAFSFKPALELLEDRRLFAGSIISGHVFDDTNNNGLFDATEKPIAGSLVELRNAGNQIIANGTTDAQGAYRFDADATISTAPTTAIRTATYSPSLAGWTVSKTIDQLDPAVGALTSVEIVLTGLFETNLKVENLESSAVTLGATTTGTVTLNGGGISGLAASGSSTIRIDVAAFDGTPDFAGESGKSVDQEVAVSGSTLKLTTQDDLARFTGKGTVGFAVSTQANTATSGGGSLATVIQTNASAQIFVIYHYIPNNALRPGSYTISQPLTTVGYFDGKDSRSGAVIDESFRTDSIAVVLGSEDLKQNDFGELAPAALSGFVYVDASNNGVKDGSEQGIDRAIVILRGTTDLGSVNRSVISGADGGFSFANLRVGTYVLSLDPLASFLDGKEGAGMLGGKVSADSIMDIAVPGGAAGSGYLFGQLRPSSLSGVVYVDANRSTAFDAGEKPVPDVSVRLMGTTDIGQQIDKTVITGADGGYAFRDLRPGKYTITETQPSGFLDNRDTVGSAGGAAANDLFSLPDFQSGLVGTGYNFGELMPSTLAGIVFQDDNNNGVQEFEEKGIANITVTLLGLNDLGATVQLTQRTSAEGKYEFTNLRPGNYTISEVQDRHFIDGLDSVGPAGGTLANDRVSNINLGTGVIASSYDFGERPMPHPFGLSYPDVAGAKDVTLPSLQEQSFSEKIPYLSTVVGSIDTDMLSRAIYVEGLYRTLLSREADLGGLAYWVQQMQKGFTRAQLVSSFWVSAEHRGLQVDQFYLTFFRRASDASGRAAWVKALQAGATEASLAQAFVLSTEYQARYKDAAAYTNALYADVLGRYAGGDEVGGWVGALQKGLARDAMAKAFLNSNEALQRIVDWNYRHLLQRAPDAAGLLGWVTQLQSGKQTIASLGQLFLSSEELFQAARRAAEG